MAASTPTVVSTLIAARLLHHGSISAEATVTAASDQQTWMSAATTINSAPASLPRALTRPEWIVTHSQPPVVLRGLSAKCVFLLI